MLRAYSSPPKPSDDSATDSASSRWVERSETFPTTKNATTMSTAMIGSSSRNSACHGKLSTIHPDSVGPMAGANATTRPKKPMAVPRLLGGNTVNSTVCMSGMVMPAPRACTMRPASSISKTCALAHSTVPAANSPMAVKNRARVEKRRIR